jgi:hypothetical protein
MEVDTGAIDRAIETRKLEIQSLEVARNILIGGGVLNPATAAGGNGRAKLTPKVTRKLEAKSAPAKASASHDVVRGAGARILAEIAKGPATNGELLRKLDLSSPGVTYQTAKLCGIRFIEQQGSKYAILPAGRAWLDSNQEGK